MGLSQLGPNRIIQMTEENYNPYQVTVTFEPGSKVKVIPRPRSVIQLLNRLDLKVGQVLVIRDGGLLTPDREIMPGDQITLRNVTSAG